MIADAAQAAPPARRALLLDHGCARLLLLLASACASQKGPNPPPAAAPESAAADSASTPAPAADRRPPAAPSASAPAEGGASAPAEPSAPPLRVVCSNMCDSLASKCTRDQVKLCHLSYCTKYITDQPACDAATREAFACAQQGKDFLLCSNVISDNCAKKFVAVQTCGATGVAPVRAPTSDRVPDGWERFQAPSAGFSVLLPKGVETHSEGGRESWVAKAGGASYEVTRQPAPKIKKADLRAFLRLATEMLGRCADKLKLYSLIEKSDRTFVHYQARCPDKSEQRGILYLQGPDYFVLRAGWSGGPNPDAESFVYSFDHK